MAQNIQAQDIQAQDSALEPAPSAGGSGALMELFLGLLWLGTSLFGAHASLRGSTDGSDGILGAAAQALPGIIAATLVTAAAIGHAASSRRRTALGRLIPGIATGTLFGFAVAVGIRLAYDTTPSITALAVTAGAASVIGGAAAVLPGDILEAGLWASTWVFFAGVMFGLWKSTLFATSGVADPSTPAAARYALAHSVVAGLAAGIYAYRNLRNGRHALGWCLIAGMVPGLILVAANLLTNAASSSVAGAGGVSADSPVLSVLNDAAQLRHALLVLAIGGFLAGASAARASLRRATTSD